MGGRGRQKEMGKGRELVPITTCVNGLGMRCAPPSRLGSARHGAALLPRLQRVMKSALPCFRIRGMDNARPGTRHAAWRGAARRMKNKRCDLFRDAFCFLSPAAQPTNALAPFHTGMRAVQFWGVLGWGGCGECVGSVRGEGKRMVWGGGKGRVWGGEGEGVGKGRVWGGCRKVVGRVRGGCVVGRGWGVSRIAHGKRVVRDGARFIACGRDRVSGESRSRQAHKPQHLGRTASRADQDLQRVDPTQCVSGSPSPTTNMKWKGKRNGPNPANPAQGCIALIPTRPNVGAVRTKGI